MIVEDFVLNDTFLAKYDCIITLGAYTKHIKSDVCLHPFLDVDTNLYIRYEAGTEEGVSALFLYEFCDNKNLKSYINDLDYGYLTSETNITEEEMSYIKVLLKKAKNPLLLVGSDFYVHIKKDNILSMLSYIGESWLNIAFLSVDTKSICKIPISRVSLKQIDELPENNGCIVYLDYDLVEHSMLKISNEFAKVWKLKDGDNIAVCLDNFSVNSLCRLDDDFGGVIGILNTNKECIDVGCRYKKAIIEKR